LIPQKNDNKNNHKKKLLNNNHKKDYNYTTYQHQYHLHQPEQEHRQTRQSPILPDSPPSSPAHSIFQYYQQDQDQQQYQQKQNFILHENTTSSGTNSSNSNNPVTVLVHKTINTVLQSSRKIIFRVCEVANVKRKFKMFNIYSTMNRRNQEGEKTEIEYTGHDRFYQERSSR